VGIVESLLLLDEIPLQLQSEPVDQHMMLEETAAGATIYEELMARKNKYAQMPRDLEVDMNEALAENDRNLEEIAREKERIEQSIQHSISEQEHLKRYRGISKQ
jgi:hypothetical protein